MRQLFVADCWINVVPPAHAHAGGAAKIHWGVDAVPQLRVRVQTNKHKHTRAPVVVARPSSSRAPSRRPAGGGAGDARPVADHARRRGRRRAAVPVDHRRAVRSSYRWMDGWMDGWVGR
jgi:hypothetical protein